MNKTPVGGWVYHTVTEDHIKLMGYTNFYHNNTTTVLDPVRPLGSADPICDVCEILGWGMEGDSVFGTRCWSRDQREKAKEILNEMMMSISVCVTSRSIKPGQYRVGMYDRTWEYVGEGEP